jgi:hypothetical protein
MDRPLDELYFQWLYSQVGPIDTNPHEEVTYWGLLKLLFTKEFVWFVPNDDNRAEDGKDLRLEFRNDLVERIESSWFKIGCSMLELLIAISRRLSFETDGEARVWFWHLINNLGLKEYHDAAYRSSDDENISDALDTVIWRTYRSTGQGGLFPLRSATSDQREVELWYQLSAYLLENGY